MWKKIYVGILNTWQKRWSSVVAMAGTTPLPYLTYTYVDTCQPRLRKSPYSERRLLHFYIKQSKKDYIPKEQPDIIKHWELGQNNAQPHVANIIVEFLTCKSIETVHWKLY